MFGHPIADRGEGKVQNGLKYANIILAWSLFTLYSTVVNRCYSAKAPKNLGIRPVSKPNWPGHFGTPIQDILGIAIGAALQAGSQYIRCR